MIYIQEERNIMRISRKDQRREEAKERQSKRDSRSDKEQIALLDTRGFTAEKERTRLLTRMQTVEKSKNKKKKATSEE